MKHYSKTEKNGILRLALFLMFATVYAFSFGQTISNGGGKVGVDISTGDPGGPWGPSLAAPQMCLEIDKCDTLELEGFAINHLLLQEENGDNITGMTYRFLGISGGVQQVEICLDETAFTGLAKLTLINTPLSMGSTGNGNGNGAPETSFWRVRVCLSLACPDCVYRVPPEENTNR